LAAAAIALSLPELSLVDIQDGLSENELASFFNDLADAARAIALTHFRSDIQFRA